MIQIYVIILGSSYFITSLHNTNNYIINLEYTLLKFHLSVIILFHQGNFHRNIKVSLIISKYNLVNCFINKVDYMQFDFCTSISDIRNGHVEERLSSKDKEISRRQVFIFWIKLFLYSLVVYIYLPSAHSKGVIVI